MKKVNLNKSIKNLKRIAVVAGVVGLFCMMGTMLTGCGGSSTASAEDYKSLGSQNVSVVYANRANSAATPTETTLKPYVMAALTSGGTCSAVRADGNPKQMEFNSERFKASKKNNEQNAEKENSNRVKEFISFLQEDQAKAQTSECDIVSAITTAAKTLPKDTDKTNTIIVVDSGISTKGRINLSNSSILNAEPESMLNIENAPDMSRVDNIVWCGYNATCDGQDAIPSSYPLYEHVQQLYTYFFKACGVKDETPIKWVANSAGILPDNRDNLPSVTKVVFDVESMFSQNLDLIRLDDAVLKFQPNVALFEDESSANDICQKLATNINKSAGSFAINGYVGVYGIELSQQRAELVRDTCIKFGANPNSITAVGKGKGPYPDLANGQYNPQNLFVEIVRQ